MELRSTYEAQAPVQHHIKSMEMLPELSGVLMIAVFVTFAFVTTAVALIRAPTSLVMYGALALAVLANLKLIHWWQRNSGSIAFTPDELIVTPRKGPSLRRYFSEITAIERSNVGVVYPGTPSMIQNYVRIISDNEIPLQFLWETKSAFKGKTKADRLETNLKTRLPKLEVLTTEEPPADVAVDHACRGGLKNYAVPMRIFAVVVCGFGGVFLNILLPRSYGAASDALKPIEQSLQGVRRTPLPTENSSEAYSISCYGENGRDSYWEEGFFNLQIRYFTLTIAVNADDKTAANRARKLLPKSWGVYSSAASPKIVGDKTTLYITSKCFRSTTSQFDTTLDARIKAVGEKIRTTVEQR
jgi:hypothetical protein